jgi:hypothetical protein
MSLLLAYRFGPGAEFEGRLLGALERIESDGAGRVLDVLFVGRDAQSGQPVAMAGRGRGEGGLVTSMVGFRLDAAERARATKRALRAYGDDGEPNPVRQLADALPPGGAIAAVLLEHARTRPLDEAAARCGGSPLLSEHVPATKLTLLGSRLVAAASSTVRPE